MKEIVSLNAGRNINLVDHGKMNKIKCKFKTYNGEYKFADYESAKKFYDNPTFTFDFSPDNCDDDMSEIFGDSDIKPIFKDVIPKFNILRINEPNKKYNTINVDVEVEMYFEVNVSQEEMIEWASDNTFKYTGRIIAENEDGLNGADIEEYDFSIAQD